MRALTFIVALLIALLAGSGTTRAQVQRKDFKAQGGWRRDGKSGEQRTGPRSGEWLRNHKDLSPSDQQKALEKDPAFRRLPPERQAQLRQRLQDFNSRPPEQRELMLHRMDTWSRLSPEQRDRARSVFQQFRSLPDDRRQAVNRAFRNLQELNPQERRQALDSPAMRNNFSDQERDMLRGMTDLNLGPSPRQLSGSDSSGGSPND